MRYPRLAQIKSRGGNIGNIGNNKHLLGMIAGYHAVDSS